MREEFLNFKQYYREAMREVSEDSFYRYSIDHKFKHSVEVLHIGQTILHHTPELKNVSDEFMRLAETALLFHDVGRFSEAVKQYEAQKENVVITAASDTFDHGLLGYEILKHNSQYCDERILFAVKWHGKMMSKIMSSADWKKAQKSADFEDIKQILFLVRDADKLANLHHIKADNHLQKDLFFRQLSSEALNAPISPLVLKQFYENHSVLFADVYSFADRILYVLAWAYDLNYQTTKDIFKRQGYVAYLLDLLAQYHSNAKDVLKIKKVLAKT